MRSACRRRTRASSSPRCSMSGLSAAPASWPPTRPATLKQRFRVGNKTLLRVSRLKQHEIDASLQARILAAVKPIIAQADLVVFSDFNYGSLAQPLVDAIASA